MNEPGYVPFIIRQFRQGDHSIPYLDFLILNQFHPDIWTRGKPNEFLDFLRRISHQEAMCGPRLRQLLAGREEKRPCVFPCRPGRTRRQAKRPPGRPR